MAGKAARANEALKATAQSILDGTYTPDTQAIQPAKAAPEGDLDSFIAQRVAATQPAPPPPEGPDVAWGDYADALQAGGADLAGAVGGALSLAGAGELGQSVTDYWQRSADAQVSQMSPEGQRQMNRGFLGEEGILSGGDNTGDAFMLKLIRTSPSLVAGFVPGAAAIKAGMGARGVALAGGLGEAGVGASFTSAEIGKAIDGLTTEQLETTFAEEWSTALQDNAGNARKAKAELKAMAQRKGGAVAGAISAATGAAGALGTRHIVTPAVNAAIKASAPSAVGKVAALGLGPASTRTGAAARAAIPGAIQEAIQESGEQLGTNVGLRADLSEGIAEAAVGGALIGGPAEAIMTGAIGPNQEVGGMIPDLAPSDIAPGAIPAGGSTAPAVTEEQFADDDFLPNAAEPETAAEVEAIKKRAAEQKKAEKKAKKKAKGEVDEQAVPAETKAQEEEAPEDTGADAAEPVPEAGPVAEPAPEPTNRLESERGQEASTRMQGTLEKVREKLAGSKAKSDAAKTKVEQAGQAVVQAAQDGSWKAAAAAIDTAAKASRAIPNSARDELLTALAADDADAVVAALDNLDAAITTKREAEPAKVEPAPDRPVASNPVEAVQFALDDWRTLEATKPTTKTGGIAKNHPKAARLGQVQAVVKTLRQAVKENLIPESRIVGAQAVLAKYGDLSQKSTNKVLDSALADIGTYLDESIGEFGPQAVAETTKVEVTKGERKEPEPEKPKPKRGKVTLKKKGKAAPAVKAKPAEDNTAKLRDQFGYQGANTLEELKTLEARVRTGSASAVLEDFYSTDIGSNLKPMVEAYLKAGGGKRTKQAIQQAITRAKDHQSELAFADRKRRKKVAGGTGTAATAETQATEAAQDFDQIVDELELTDQMQALEATLQESAEEDRALAGGSDTGAALDEGLAVESTTSNAAHAQALKIARESGSEGVRGRLAEVDRWDKAERKAMRAAAKAAKADKTADPKQAATAINAMRDLHKEEVRRRQIEAMQGDAVEAVAEDSITETDNRDEAYTPEEYHLNRDLLRARINAQNRRMKEQGPWMDLTPTAELMSAGGEKAAAFVKDLAARVGVGDITTDHLSVNNVLKEIAQTFGKGHPWGSIAKQLGRINFGEADVFMRDDGKDRRAWGFVQPDFGWAEQSDGSITGVYRESDVFMTPVGQNLALSEFANADSMGTYVSTILHEIVHLATLQRMAEGHPGTDEVLGVYDHVREHPDVAAAYGGQDVTEFIAEALTNPELQKVLASIPMKSKGGRLLTAWKQLLNGLRHLLNMRTVTNSALEQVLEASNSLLAPGETNVRRYYQQNNLDPDLTVMVRSQQQRAGRRKDEIASRADHNALFEGDTREMTKGLLARYVGEDGRAVYQVDDDGQLHMRTKDGSHEVPPYGLGTMYGKSDIAAQAGIAKRRVTDGKMGQALRRGQWWVHSFNDLVDRYANKFTVGGVSLLRKYQQSQQERQKIITQERKKIDTILSAWRKGVNSKSRATFDLVLRDSTQEQLDLSAPWASPANQHWSKHKDPKIKAAKLAKYKALRRKLQGTQGEDIYRQLKEFFEAAFEGQRKVTIERLLKTEGEALGLRKTEGGQEYFDHAAITKLSRLMDAMKGSKRNEIKRALYEAAGGKEFENIDRLVKALTPIVNSKRSPGPYFPLRRYGKFVTSFKRKSVRTFATKAEAETFRKRVNANVEPGLSAFTKASVQKEADGNGKFVVNVTEQHVEFSESKFERDEIAQRLIDKGIDPNDIATEEKNSFLNTIGNIAGASALAEQLKKGVEFKGLQTSIDQTIIEMIELTAARAGQQNRMNIAGASTDMFRAIAERADAHAWAMADMATITEQSELMSRMRTVAKSTDMTALVNHLNDREERTTKQDRVEARIVNGITSGGYLYYLGSPSYSMVNLTQQVLVGYPWLIGELGTASATKHMLVNMGVGGKAASKEFLRTSGGFTSLPDQFMDALASGDKQGKRKDKISALIHLTDMGLIDATFIQELQGAKAGGWTQNQFIEYMTLWARSAPQLVEQFNRVVVGGAAYDGARARGDNHLKAQETARRAIVESQFDYSGLNRPLAFRALGSWSRVVFMFKMYGQGMYSLLFRNLGKVWQNAEPGDRVAGVRFMASFSAVNFLAAGALGSLMMEPLRAFATAIAAMMDDEDDGQNWEVEFQNAMYEQGLEWGMTEAQARTFTDSIAWGGLRNVTGADFASRVGTQNLLLMPIINREGTIDNAVMEWSFQLLGGPAANILRNAAKGLDKGAQGRVGEGIEQMLPKGMRDLSRAIRRYDNPQLTQSGRESLEGHTLYQSMVQAFGFSPTADAQRYNAMEARYNYENTLTDARKNLLYRYYRAEPSERNRIWREDIKDWNRNQARNDRKLRITGSQLRQGVRGVREDNREAKGGTKARLDSTNRAIPYAR